MPSKLVLNHQRTAESVSAAIETHTPRVVSALEQRLSSLLKPGEEMPNLALFVSLLERLSAQDLTALTAADRLLETERLEDTDARSQRDAAFSALSALAGDLSSDVAFIFGDAARAKVHMDGTLPNNPTTLVETTDRCVNALTSNALPPPRRADITFDAPQRASTLRAATDHMRSTYRAVNTETRETEAALIDRDAAALQYNATFTRVAGIFERICDLANDPALSSRIRRASSKPGTTLEDPLTAATDADESPSPST
jgi:hypothetical protein